MLRGDAWSISPRKSFQGEGSLAVGVSPGIGKLFRPHVREQVPMYRIGGSILRKPLSLSLGHGRTIEKPFFRKAAFLKHLFEIAEFLRSGVVAMTLGHAPPKPNDKTQLVLKIEFPGGFDQPRIWPPVLHRYPRQSLRHAAIETRLSQCRKQHLIRVLPWGMCFEVSETGIFEP